MIAREAGAEDWDQVCEMGVPLAGNDFCNAIINGDLDDACAAYNKIIEWYPEEAK